MNSTNAKPVRVLIYLEAFIAVVIWGAGFVFTKIALIDFSPVQIVFVRFGIGVLILGLTVFVRGEFRLPKPNEVWYLALTGFIGVTFHQWLQATGLQTAQATVTAWIVATIPIFTMILGVLFLKEKSTILSVVGTFLSAIGVLLVVSKGDLFSIISGSFGTYGDKLIMISALNWAVFSILSRSGLRKFPPALMMFYVMFFGWLMSGIWFYAAGESFNFNIPWAAPSVLSLLVLGIFGSGVAYITWYDALKEIPVSQLSVFIYIEPIITMALAVVMLNETINTATILGGIFTVVGIILVNRK